MSVKENVDALEAAVWQYVEHVNFSAQLAGSPPPLWLWKNQTFKGMAVPYPLYAKAKAEGSCPPGRSLQTGRAGSPDIAGFGVLADGRECFVGIEMKTGSAVQTPEQKACEAACRRLGGVYVLARSAADVEAALGWPGVRTSLLARMEEKAGTDPVPF